MNRLLIVAVIASLIACATSTTADNWPAWRGPRGDGHCDEKNLPAQWSPTENVRWKATLPSPGNSSPIVWGNAVFLTQSLDREGRQRALMCFDRRDGKLLWQKIVEYAEKESTYAGEPHYCSASPTTDGERVIASFGSAGVLCCDFTGKELWRRDLGKCQHLWGNAASPVLHGDLVILNFGPGERTFLIALNKKTGEEVWRVEEPGGKYGHHQAEWIGSWCTPVVARLGRRDELIMSWPLAVKSYDPRTGKLLWSCGGLSKLVYPAPLVTPDAIVAMSGFHGPYLAVKPGGEGDVTETHRLWRVTQRAPQRIGSGVVVGEHIYILNEPGVAQCLELKTGRTLWEERAGGSSWGSMVCADGKLYVTNRQAETLVLAAKPQFELLAQNRLGGRSNSSPAIANGAIFLRTWEALWCISAKPQ